MDVSCPSFKPVPTQYKILHKANGLEKELELTPELIVEKYWNESVVKHIVKNSNAYVQERKEREPELGYWKKKFVSDPFTLANTYHFIAILYYFGIVCLPVRSDYWSEHQLMPLHPDLKEM